MQKQYTAVTAKAETSCKHEHSKPTTVFDFLLDIVITAKNKAEINARKEPFHIPFFEKALKLIKTMPIKTKNIPINLLLVNFSLKTKVMHFIQFTNLSFSDNKD